MGINSESTRTDEVEREVVLQGETRFSKSSKSISHSTSDGVVPPLSTTTMKSADSDRVPKSTS